MRFHRNSRRGLAKLIPLLASACIALTSAEAHAEAKRPPHITAQAGYYAALGGPAGWGQSLALDVLPGWLAGRWGMRLEYRGYRGLSGSILASALFEAGASRPKLALKLAPTLGITENRDLIVGAGMNWSLWLLGPLGVSMYSDLQVILRGAQTRPALTFALSAHLGF